jgi:hypothetical protein
MDAAVTNFWRHADRLYKALSSAWRCQCASEHWANILLQHSSLADLEFMLLFMSYSSGHQTSGNWKLRATSIKLLDPPPSDKLFTQITITTSDNGSQPSKSPLRK